MTVKNAAWVMSVDGCSCTYCSISGLQTRHQAVIAALSGCSHHVTQHAIAYGLTVYNYAIAVKQYSVESQNTCEYMLFI